MPFPCVLIVALGTGCDSSVELRTFGLRLFVFFTVKNYYEIASERDNWRSGVTEKAIVSRSSVQQAGKALKSLVSSGLTDAGPSRD